MKGLAACILLLSLPAVARAAEPPCDSPLGPAVPDAETARKIAMAVIAARPATPATPEYRLVVEADQGAPGNWRAYQALPAGGSLGGGGLSMRIERCTGRVSDLYHQR